MNSGNLRVAVLGVGRIGKIHAQNLAGRIRRAELAAIADVVPDELAAVAAALNAPRTYMDPRPALEAPDIDAVVICTPTNTHCELILAAAQNGKHVFCEKPVDLSIEKVARVNAAVRESGIKLMVGFNRRFDPHFLKVRETVKAGKIGVPHLLRITSRDPGPPPENYIRASGGIFLDMTIHDFDMARYLMGGEVTEVYTRANVLVDPVFRNAGDWDTAIVTLAFDNGALGAIDNSRKTVYGYDQRVEVFGSGGMIAVANQTPDNHVFLDLSGTHSALPLNFFMDRYTESYWREMQAFVDAVQDGKPVPVDGNDGLAALAIGLAAGQSARENRPVKPAIS